MIKIARTKCDPNKSIREFNNCGHGEFTDRNQWHDKKVWCWIFRVSVFSAFLKYTDCKQQLSSDSAAHLSGYENRKQVKATCTMNTTKNCLASTRQQHKALSSNSEFKRDFSDDYNHRFDFEQRCVTVKRDYKRNKQTVQSSVTLKKNRQIIANFLDFCRNRAGQKTEEKQLFR